MSTKIKSSELVSIADAAISIVDGVATIDGPAITGQTFERFGVDHAAVRNAYDAVAATSNAVSESFSNKAQDFLAANPDVDSVNGVLEIPGAEKFTYTSHRERSHRNLHTNEMVVTKGSLSVTRTIETRKGELKSIKQLAKERAINVL